ncbi:hypothetical protein L218DRAFT_764642 [Marasmius fiardii PR-910]|nr:hypothetical protein L218DRAFT_764642 [Marasmius fiardii PR-910]
MVTNLVDPRFTTNDTPYPSQEAMSRQIDGFSTAMRSLDSETVQFQATLTNSQQPREVLETRPASFHPVRELPAEILVVIFAFCVDQDIRSEELKANLERVRDSPPPTLDITKSPWVLSHVCRQWRELALSTSHLWNTVEAVFDETQEESGLRPPSLLPLVGLRLERAQCQSLSVTLDMSFLCDYLPSFMRPSLSRWRNVTICAPTQCFYSLDVCKGKFPTLSALHLHFKSTSWNLSPITYDQLSVVFMDTPSLRRLTLSGDAEVLTSPLLSGIPWNQITHFTTKDLFLPSHFLDTSHHPFYSHLLPLLQNVQECRSELVRFHTEPSPTTSLTLSHLCSLVFTGRNDIVPLSDYLHLPALRSLGFVNVESRGVVDAIVRHSGELETLVFDGIDIQVEEFVRILGLPCLRNLRTLKILQGFSGGGCEELLLALSTTRNPDGVVYLSNLRHLTLGCRSGAEECCWPMETMVEMVESRMMKGVVDGPLGRFSRLESFMVEGFCVEETALRVVLEGLRKEGLVFRCC